MEDAYSVENGGRFAAVFDGHGGYQVSKYVSENLVRTMIELDAYRNGDYETALTQAYYAMDDQMRKIHHKIAYLDRGKEKQEPF